jgi:hypothetical protein
MMATPANSINETTTGVVGFTGTAFTATAVTQHDVLIGGSTSSTITNVAPSATSGVPLISQGASADPIFGTAVVAGGGTGLTSATAYAVLTGGTTSTGAFQSIASVGTSGQVLTSNGAGALPTFQTLGTATITITGDSGGALTASSFTFTGGTSGLTFAGSGSTETLSGTLVVANGGTGATTLTSHGVLLGNTTSAVTATAAGTNGQVLIGSTSAAPAFASLTSSGSTLTYTTGANTLNIDIAAPVSVANGGTGDTSLTAYAVLCGGTTSTAAVQSIASVGTSGQVLTSNGAGALPTFQAAPGGGVLQASISLTNSQIKALVGTPITLVAAPGSGNFVNIINGSSSLTYGGTNAFTNASNVPISLFFGANTNAAICEVLSQQSVVATSSQFFIGAPAMLGANASSTANNAAVIISIPSGSTNIGGNAANNNTMKVFVTYQILAL